MGAKYLGDGRCVFTVWAPQKRRVDIKIVRGDTSETHPMRRDSRGYWRATLEGVRPGTRYFYTLDGETDRPDPASNFQPEGVHGPSQVVDHASFRWGDSDWRGLELADMVLYELHVGAFTPEGTFEAIIPRLDELLGLGVNALELMPVAQFPGKWNWGYDGVYPYAVQNTYGGVEGLKRLVDECHRKGVAVVLDVVYNHLGPEGNYLHDFGPYFSQKYRTPWGEAINFDGPSSDEVRDFFVENALYWLREFHVDGLRLDAVHAIFDMSAKHFLRELAERVEEYSRRLWRRCWLIAESDLNDPKIIGPKELGGYGLDAQWLDDYHHALHALLTGEAQGYYSDFGGVEHFVKAAAEGYVYSGQYSKHRGRRHGASSKECPAHSFIVFAQNHDQVGNRMLGERLSALVSFEALKLAAGAVVLSPYIPLIFMGEEYGEDGPFMFFADYSDPRLAEAVRKGRAEEFKAFGWAAEPPDPLSPQTFERSKIRWEKRLEAKHRVLLEFYRHLIALRRSVPALSRLQRDGLEVCGLEAEKLVFIRRRAEASDALCVFNFNTKDVGATLPLPRGDYRKLLDSSEARWGGAGPSLPDRVGGGESVVVKALSLAVFLGSGGGEDG